METTIGSAMFRSSFPTGITPILFSFNETEAIFFSFVT